MSRLYPSSYFFRFDNKSFSTISSLLSIFISSFTFVLCWNVDLHHKHNWNGRQNSFFALLPLILCIIRSMIYATRKWYDLNIVKPDHSCLCIPCKMFHREGYFAYRLQRTSMSYYDNDSKVHHLIFHQSETVSIVYIYVVPRKYYDAF